jgi:hypothetical protein
MDITESKRDLHVIIEQMPDDSLEEARRLLRALLEGREAHDPEFISVEPFDRSRARPEFLRELDEAIESSKRGEVISHEEVGKEIFRE